jgi:hypothetical protein
MGSQQAGRAGIGPAAVKNSVLCLVMFVFVEKDMDVHNPTSRIASVEYYRT